MSDNLHIQEEGVEVHLSESIKDDLRDGETVELLIQAGDGFMDVLEIEWYAKGTIGGRELSEEYSDVIGLGDSE